MDKFHRLRNGQVQKVAATEGRCIVRPEEEWIVHRTAVPPLVDPHLWEAVQVKMPARGDRTRGARVRKATLPLGRLIKCADCGAPMDGVRQGGGVEYRCSTYHQSKGCSYNAVREEGLLSVLKEVVLEKLFNGGNLALLEKAIYEDAKAPPDCQGRDVEGPKRELAKAKAQHQRAAQNLLLADPENVPALDGAMSDLRRRIRALEGGLAALRAPLNPKALVAERPRPWR